MLEFSSKRLALLVTGAVAALIGAASPALGQANLWEKEIDFDLLLADEGAERADGRGVNVTLVESSAGGGYAPDLAEPSFAGKTVTLRSGESAKSNHANVVAKYFFGLDGKAGFTQRSIAPSISNVEVYSASAWLGRGYLTGDGHSAPPPVSLNNSRVASHAYLPRTDANQIRRLDYLVATDDFIQVTAGADATVTGLGASFNGIAVGHVKPANNGHHGTDSSLAGYPAGRHKPDLVGTFGTSDAIGQVSAAAALLVDLGADATLSKDSYTGSRTRLTIRHAQTSETVKAALMAGASRSLPKGDAHQTGIAISDYRAAPVNQTANGLDTRFGAGRLNINQSYKIIQGREQDSAEDDSHGNGTIDAYGFDYDPSFGGANASNTTASYRFATEAQGGRLTATLAWNVPIITDGDFNSSAVPVFHGIELLLFDITPSVGDPLKPIASSSSPIDNTQSLWFSLAGNREYLLQVRSLETRPFDQDFSLAWRIDGWVHSTTLKPGSR